VTPRLAAPRTAAPAAADEGAPGAGAWEWFAVALFAVGSAAGIVLAIVERSLPPPAPFVLLAVLLACAVNRFALFPTELAVTAEIAVLLAAIVWFHSDSPLTAPWLLAFLAGAFDLVHWRQRSFVRMAYNAGQRMIATLVASMAFAGVLDVVGSSSVVAIGAAALGASLAFAVVEAAVGTVLVRLRDREAWSSAARVELPMELLSLPLGIVGAAAGYLGLEMGWWAAALVLVPTLFVPEIAFVPRRGQRSWRVPAPLLLVGAIGLVVVALVSPLPELSTLASLAVVALAVGLEARVDAARPVPALASTVVVAAFVVSERSALVVAGAVAIIATVGAGCAARVCKWWAPLLAGVAGCAAAALYDLHPSRASALVAALAFEFVVLTRPERVVWTAPIVGAAAVLADAWRAVGAWGALVFGSGLFVTLVVAVAYGAPPWQSRFLSRWASRQPTAAHRMWYGLALVGAAACGIAASEFPSTREVLVPVAAAAAAAITARSLVAVRQWRFQPRRRVRDAAVVLAAACGVVLVYPPLGLDGSAWAPVILASGVAISWLVARPLARRAAMSKVTPDAARSGRSTPSSPPSASTRPSSSAARG
jgi:hypothetical protein